MFDRIKKLTVESWARVQNDIRAWRSPDKIVVIESDDWGSIRTSSIEAYHELIRQGYSMDRSCWGRDALETDEDLEKLFDVLNKHKDSRGRPACITANIVMANPDFKAIESAGFREYHFEPVGVTLKASATRKNVSQLWQEGMNKRCFVPQFHAREHIRWWHWLESLRAKSPESLDTFRLHMCGVPAVVSEEMLSFFQPIYIDNPSTDSASLDVSAMIRQGVRLFEEQFGFRSLSTIAPNCAWTDSVEKTWAEQGVRYIQGGYCQRFFTHKEERLVPHYLGQRSRHEGWYLVRNCTFEPVKDLSGYAWKKCLIEIERAFRLKTPAIINSHRVNYAGSIVQDNRDQGLSQLEMLLKKITEKWPEAHFLCSPELGLMIEHSINRVSELADREAEVFPVVSSEPDSNRFTGSDWQCPSI